MVKQISLILVIFVQVVTQVINNLNSNLFDCGKLNSIQNPLPRRVLTFLYPLFVISPVSHLLTFGIKNTSCRSSGLRILIPKTQPVPRDLSPIRYQTLKNKTLW